jgi:hypothetical protein
MLFLGELRSKASRGRCCRRLPFPLFTWLDALLGPVVVADVRLLPHASVDSFKMYHRLSSPNQATPRDNFDVAYKSLVQIIERRRQVLRSAGPVIPLMLRLARLLSMRTQQRKDARRVLQQCLEAVKTSSQNAAELNVATMRELGRLYEVAYDLLHAESWYKQAVAFAARALPGSLEYLRCSYDLLSVRLRSGRAHLDSVTLSTLYYDRETSGSRDWIYVGLGNNLAAVLAVCGQTREAVTQLEKLVALKQLPVGALRWVMQANIAFVMSSQGMEAEAALAMQVAFSGLMAAVGDGHSEAQALIMSRIRMEMVWGRTQEAQRLAKHIVNRVRKSNDDSLLLSESLLLLDEVMTVTTGPVPSLVHSAVSLLDARLPAWYPDLVRARCRLATSLWMQNEGDSASVQLQVRV